MNTIEGALSRLTEAELVAIAEATYATAPAGSPGLLAGIRHCADVEQHWRRGTVLPIRPPDSAIPPEEDVQALAAMIALREAADADNVRTLYAAMVKLLSAGPRH